MLPLVISFCLSSLFYLFPRIVFSSLYVFIHPCFFLLSVFIPCLFSCFSSYPVSFLFLFVSSFLGALAYCRKTPINFISVRPAALSLYVSVRMYQRGSHWTDFHKVLCWGLLRKFVGKLQIFLKVGQKYRALYMKTQVHFVAAGYTHSP